jgi:hypothetical protein
MCLFSFFALTIVPMRNVGIARGRKQNVWKKKEKYPSHKRVFFGHPGTGCKRRKNLYTRVSLFLM